MQCSSSPAVSSARAGSAPRAVSEDPQPPSDPRSPHCPRLPHRRQRPATHRRPTARAVWASPLPPRVLPPDARQAALVAAPRAARAASPCSCCRSRRPLVGPPRARYRASARSLKASGRPRRRPRRRPSRRPPRRPPVGTLAGARPPWAARLYASASFHDPGIVELHTICDGIARERRRSGVPGGGGFFGLPVDRAARAWYTRICWRTDDACRWSCAERRMSRPSLRVSLSSSRSFADGSGADCASWLMSSSTAPFTYGAGEEPRSVHCGSGGDLDCARCLEIVGLGE